MPPDYGTETPPTDLCQPQMKQCPNVLPGDNHDAGQGISCGIWLRPVFGYVDYLGAAGDPLHNRDMPSFARWRRRFLVLSTGRRRRVFCFVLKLFERILNGGGRGVRLLSGSRLVSLVALRNLLGSAATGGNQNEHAT